MKLNLTAVDRAELMHAFENDLSRFDSLAGISMPAPESWSSKRFALYGYGSSRAIRAKIVRLVKAGA